jgi:hypothetical protein
MASNMLKFSIERRDDDMRGTILDVILTIAALYGLLGHGYCGVNIGA